VPIDHFACTREDDAGGGHRAAQPMGMGGALSAAEPGGIFGGYPAPAPAAAGPEPVIPDTDVEPVLGGARLAHDRPSMGGGSAGGSVSAPRQGSGSVAPGAETDSDGEAADLYVALGPGEAAMDRFVTDYLQLLDGRVDTIRRCLDDSDIEGARVAILSLESSSVMLGGGPLAGRLAELRSHLDLGPTPQRNALLALVESAASVFRSELESAGRG
jgi:hypothetical protein